MLIGKYDDDKFSIELTHDEMDALASMITDAVLKRCERVNKRQANFDLGETVGNMLERSKQDKAKAKEVRDLLFNALGR